MGMKSLSDPSESSHVEAVDRYSCRCTGLTDLAVEENGRGLEKQIYVNMLCWRFRRWSGIWFSHGNVRGAVLLDRKCASLPAHFQRVEQFQRFFSNVDYHA